jgi:hypothetical protein
MVMGKCSKSLPSKQLANIIVFVKNEKKGKTKMKLKEVFIALAITAVLFGLLMYATSAKVWYAGEHTAECDGSADCGCYEKLLEMDRENAETITRSSKR